MSTAVRTSPDAIGTRHQVESDTLAALDATEQLVRACAGSLSASTRSIDDAARRARTLAAGGAGELAPAALLADVLPELSKGDVGTEQMRLLLDATAGLTGATTETLLVQVAQQAAAGQMFVDLPPEPAIDAALRLLLVLAPVRHVSLWQIDAHGEARCVSRAGSLPTKKTAELARRFARGTPADRSTGLLLGTRVEAQDCAPTALLARPEAGGRRRCAALVDQFQPVLRAQLIRRELIRRAAAAERLLADSLERRLSRLAFDIHDGPLQNVAGITGDVQALRRRLRQALPDGGTRRQLLGCVDDFEARLQAVDVDLRDLSHSLESPAAGRAPFSQLVHEELEAFRRRTDIRPSLRLDGDLDDTTASQRIALWRIVQETLANAREHSGARELRVEARATAEELSVEIVDDGRGFDVPDTLLDAARRGRMGLVGVSERVRLLGGRCNISSKRGGPTTVSVTLPRWRPER